MRRQPTTRSRRKTLDVEDVLHTDRDTKKRRTAGRFGKRGLESSEFVPETTKKVKRFGNESMDLRLSLGKASLQHTHIVRS
jgi:hypothetical protein